MPTRKYSRLGRVRGCARPTLLIFSLVALSPPRTASGRAPSPRRLLRKSSHRVQISPPKEKTGQTDRSILFFGGEGEI